MNSGWYDIGLEYINIVFLLFTTGLMVLYSCMGYMSTRNSVHYRNKNSFGKLTGLGDSLIAPSISIIAPAYNEGLTIIENIRSLLSLNYENYEVIVVNDGSKDDTVQKMIDTFDMVRVPAPKDPNWRAKPVRGVYKPKSESLRRLILIDKENGGKSDALNAGISFSRSKYVGCIDVDCLLHPDALLHVVKSFIQPSQKRVIAVGGVIRVANSCTIEDGLLKEIRLPKNWLAKFQLLEYTRSFLIGRMAWGRIDSLLIISGAFGFFDREITADREAVSRQRKVELVVFPSAVDCADLVLVFFADHIHELLEPLGGLFLAQAVGNFRAETRHVQLL